MYACDRGEKDNDGDGEMDFSSGRWDFKQLYCWTPMWELLLSITRYKCIICLCLCVLALARHTRQGRIHEGKGHRTASRCRAKYNITGILYCNIVTDLLFSSNEIYIIFMSFCITLTPYYIIIYLSCRFIPTSNVRYRRAGFFFL